MKIIGLYINSYYFYQFSLGTNLFTLGQVSIQHEIDYYFDFSILPRKAIKMESFKRFFKVNCQSPGPPP